MGLTCVNLLRFVVYLYLGVYIRIQLSRISPQLSQFVILYAVKVCVNCLHPFLCWRINLSPKNSVCPSDTVAELSMV